jgi:NAD(P)-dependent dehydrogenase (short-subunit alcohol dehydrogenase family)
MSAAELAGKPALVTGGGRGIGQAIAVGLAAAGAKVAVAGRDQSALDESIAAIEAAGGEALAVRADVTDPAQVERMAETALTEHGPAEILVANSGIEGPTRMLWEVTDQEWDETFAVNVSGVFRSCRAVLPAMIANGRGSVIVIGSITARLGLLARSPYAASKAALGGLVRTLALEGGRHGVRANVVLPGAVEGERLDRIAAEQARIRDTGADEVRTKLAERAALRSLVRAESIADAVVFLASERAAAITGQELNVDAGTVLA